MFLAGLNSASPSADCLFLPLSLVFMEDRGRGLYFDWQVMTPDGTHAIGTTCKQWKEVVEEVFTDADHYAVTCKLYMSPWPKRNLRYFRHHLWQTEISLHIFWHESS